MRESKNIIAYHGSLSETPPHLLRPTTSYANYIAGVDPTDMGFHAGTINAALERVGSHQMDREDNDYFDDEEPETKAYMHAYEIPKKHLSLLTYEDPHEQGYSDLNDTPDGYMEAMKVKETRQDKVNRYQNRWEDPGSTSYVIPHHLMRTGSVKHLSTQQFNVRTDDIYVDRDTLTQNAKAKKK
jgi:hypothetical protein